MAGFFPLLEIHGVSYTNFRMAFWHPFGPHGGEPRDRIIDRKRAEIEANGWTLWSFQYRLMLDHWHHELLAAKRDTVFVFCSEGRGAVDPAKTGTLNKPIDCQSYRFVGEEDSGYQPMPNGVRVPHPFRPGNKLASAFVVQRITYRTEPFQGPVVEWFSLKKGPWRQERVPPRGEYLIRPGGTITMRRVNMVLELKPPYLAVVNKDEVRGGGILA